MRRVGCRNRPADIARTPSVNGSTWKSSHPPTRPAATIKAPETQEGRHSKMLPFVAISRSSVQVDFRLSSLCGAKRLIAWKDWFEKTEDGQITSGVVTGRARPWHITGSAIRLGTNTREMKRSK